jgi:hypothetical protein
VNRYLTRGERGIEGKSLDEADAIRTAESEKACSTLKTRAVFAGQINGDTEINGTRYAEFRAYCCLLRFSFGPPSFQDIHWKYLIGNAIVHRDVYHADLRSRGEDGALVTSCPLLEKGRRSIQTSLWIEQSCGYSHLPAVVKLLEHVLYALANLTPALLGIGP